MSSYKFFIIGFLLSVAELSFASQGIISFSPTGAVMNVQQVRVQFATSMTPMGNPRDSSKIFAVNCNNPDHLKIDESQPEKNIAKVSPPAYSTRWADPTNWVLEFKQPLPAGISCTFILKDNVKDLKGNPVTTSEEYSFSTGGPTLRGIYPKYGDIEPDQYFVILADGPLNPQSVEKLAYFEVEGIPGKINVRLKEEKLRDEIIKAAIKHNWAWNNYQEIINNNAKTPISKLKMFDLFYLIAADRRFPEGAKLKLHWPKGILSKSGLPTVEAQQFEFSVIKPFEAQFTCERVAPEKPCNPITPMNLYFTRSVDKKSLVGTKLVSKSKKSLSWTPKELTEAELKKISNVQFINSLKFSAPFPELSQFEVILPHGVKDEFGRPLANFKKFPLTVGTDEYSPLLKFSAPFGILELKADPILPVSVRNIEDSMGIQQLQIEGKSINLNNQNSVAEIIQWYEKVLQKNQRSDFYADRNTPLLQPAQGLKFQMPKPLGSHEFEVVGIPLKKPGLYVVEMESPRLGLALTGQAPMYVATAALVTDMAVHFKKGRDSSLIWVTQLSNAKPISGAKVSLHDSSGKVLISGKTNSEGIFKFNSIQYPCGFNAESEPSKEGHELNENCDVYAFAKKEDDFSFASSQWNKGIESYRFKISTEYLDQQWGPIVLHSVLNRTAAQPGETIEMKHLLREHHATGFTFMNEKRLPKNVYVVHQGSNKIYTLPFQYDRSTGSAINQFKIPKEASLGRYNIYLSNKDSKPAAETKASPSDPSSESEIGSSDSAFDWSSQLTGSFVVSEYRLPNMKSNIKIQGEPLVTPSEVKADLSAHYLSGGPAKGLKVKLRASILPSSFMPDVPGASSYNFFSKPLKAGFIQEESRQSKETDFLKVQDLTLNSDGGALATIKGLPPVKKIEFLSLEMEYTDPNGEIRTSSAGTALFPGETIVGLKTDSWYYEIGKSKLFGVITNNLGKTLPNQPYIVEAFQSKYITHRKRLVGGFYSYDSKTEIKSLGKVCEGKSDSNGQFQCSPKNLPAGDIYLQAKTWDSKQRATYANVDVRIYEEGSQTWWVQSDSDRIDILTEKTRYEPGEKAKLIIQSPYQTSQVLVTVEREGVLDSFVTEVQRDNPVVEVPIKEEYAPNVFISAVAIRGRVGETKPTALVDLSRPGMKMGLTEINVGWKGHELLVNLKTNKSKYHTREKAQVTIQVKSSNGGKLPSGVEVAVVAVDEALLRLKENSTWKVLKAMMGGRSLAVETSSGQNQVIGRRHFGAKAKEPGGSGGSMGADPRDLFDPILLWQPHLKLDSSGQGKISIPLNDSLTNFRIVAVATAGANLFGDGSTNIESTKDLIIYSGFAPHAREGDQIKNAFTLRNTSAKAMKVKLSVTSKEILSLASLPAVELNPSEAKTIDLPLTVPDGITEINFQIKAKDEMSGAEDAMIAKVKISPAVPTQVLQSTLFQLTQNQTIPAQKPKDALPGRGGLSVNARTSLAQSFSGVRSYMDDYPYSCLEQQISRAIVLGEKSNILTLLEKLPSYLDSQGLLKFFPSQECGSPVLTRYIINILLENEYTIPEKSRTAMQAGLTNSINGKFSCHFWWDDFLKNPYASEEKILLMESLSRLKAFNNSMLSTINITPLLWKTETLVAFYQLLKREPSISNREALLKQVDTTLRSRVNFQGSLMNLQKVAHQGDDWEYQWRLFTSHDQEAMSVFRHALDENSWSNDVGRMARGMVARLHMGHWDTTTANAWGITTFNLFSKKFESEKITGETQVKFNDLKRSINWSRTNKGDSLDLNWPKELDAKPTPIQISHTGSGKPWVQVTARAAIPLKAPLELGYKVQRKLTPVVQTKQNQWSKGDVVNIEITVTALADQAWVVVRDPIPAGASHLGTDLEGTSQLLNFAPKNLKSKGGKASLNDVDAWPTEFHEKSQSQFISYASYLPRGRYRLNYRIRLNSAGDFKLPPTRVEAMYAPETFGEVPNANFKVGP